MPWCDCNYVRGRKTERATLSVSLSSTHSAPAPQLLFIFYCVSTRVKTYSSSRILVRHDADLRFLLVPLLAMAEIPVPLIAESFCGSILADCFVLTPHNNQLRHCQRNTHSTACLLPSLRDPAWSVPWTSTCEPGAPVVVGRQRPQTGSPRRGLAWSCADSVREAGNNEWVTACFIINPSWSETIPHTFKWRESFDSKIKILGGPTSPSFYITVMHWWVCAPLPKVTQSLFPNSPFVPSSQFVPHHFKCNTTSWTNTNTPELRIDSPWLIILQQQRQLGFAPECCCVSPFKLSCRIVRVPESVSCSWRGNNHNPVAIACVLLAAVLFWASRSFHTVLSPWTLLRCQDNTDTRERSVVISKWAKRKRNGNHGRGREVLGRDVWGEIHLAEHPQSGVTATVEIRRENVCGPLCLLWHNFWFYN